MQNLTGHTIGHYSIQDAFDGGGMAVVYKAFDTRLDRMVAIKVIRVDEIPPARLERIFLRFEQEAKATAQLQHPNIIPIIDYGKYENAPYQVMPYIKGGNLKELQATRKRMDYSEAARLLSPIARALEYAHSKGIAHRDIKPSNILLTENGQPMLTDFGIAKIFEGDNSTGKGWTDEGRAIGTPEYMSKEQWLCQEIDGRTDIYSLGVVFYELITGQVPFQAETYPIVMNMMLNDPLKSPREFVPDLPEVVEYVLLKALARDRENRYSDMGQFALALEKLAQKDTEKKPVQNPDVKPVPTVPNGTTSEDLISGGVGTSKKSKWWKWAFGGLGLVLAIFFFSRLFGSSTVVEPVEPKNGTQPPQTTRTVPSQPAANKEPGIGSTRTREKDGMMMVYVPAGEFIMGSDSGDRDEIPAHNVMLDAFWIDQTEITNGMYKKCVENGACQLPGNVISSTKFDYYENTGYSDFPVIYVDWEKARRYCEWAGGRLPREAEWEKAARGTDGRTYPWGENAPYSNLLNYNRLFNDTTRVADFENGKSPYGAYDMAGNVSEWVADWYDIYPGGISSVFFGFGTEFHVVRGGSWFFSGNYVRSADRDKSVPSFSNDQLGFRCASSAERTISNTFTTSISPESSKLISTMESKMSDTTAQQINASPKFGIGSTEIREKDGMVMVYVPAGEFIMGSNVGSDEEKPEHKVYLDAFWIDQTEVTNGMYEKCVQQGGCVPPVSYITKMHGNYYGNSTYNDFPVVNINWDEAQFYCEWAGGRLPTEEEWEKTARGTDGRTYPWGGTKPDNTLLNFDQNIRDTTRVGNYENGKSPYGAYDMAGNVWEWVAGWYEMYPGGDPQSSGYFGMDYRVLKGGSSNANDFGVRSSLRIRFESPRRDDDVGFRCALDISP